MSDLPVLFRADLIFKDFSRKLSKFKYFSFQACANPGMAGQDGVLSMAGQDGVLSMAGQNGVLSMAAGRDGVLSLKAAETPNYNSLTLNMLDISCPHPNFVPITLQDPS